MNDIDSAKKAIEEKRYAVAARICSSLIEAGHRESEVYITSARALLLSTSSPSNSSQINAFKQCVSLGLNAARDYYEVCEVEFGAKTAYFEWYDERIRCSLRHLINYPALANCVTYLNQLPQYDVINASLLISTATNANAQALRSYENDADAIWKQYDENTPEVLTESQRKTLEYETGLSIFQIAINYLEENNNLHATAMQNLAQSILEKFMVAETVIDWSLPEEKNSTEEKEIIAERLKTKAECMNYRLKALIYPNGQPMSLFYGDGRSNDINKLRELYNKIQIYDPDFIAPVLPSIEGTKLQAPQSKGGCYVAAAIYGSYNCPEVWTLRRFRDYTLAETWYGRAFIRTYYAISPMLVNRFGKTEWFIGLWKPALDKMVKRLKAKGVSDMPYQDQQL